MLLAGCLAIAAAVEVTARLGFDRFSKIQRRTAEEYRLATTIGRGGVTGSRRVLVVGNSLLKEDVQFDELRAALGSHCDTRRFIVEQTGYLDWYYGMRRLFRDGARPDVVVLILTARQSIGTDIRGDYSAQYLFDKSDLPAVTRELELNPTLTTNLFLSGFSKFWGTRAEIRNFVLGHMMPDLGRLMVFSSVVDPRPLLDREVYDVMRERLARLKAMTDAHGAKLVFVLPPVGDPRDGADAVFRAGKEAGVDTLRPVASGTLPSRLYSDGSFHLNPTGAQIFTSELIPLLREEVESPADDRHNQMTLLTGRNVDR